MAGRTILLAAGGTGGHLFPAEALAHELAARGHAVHLATDQRAERYAGDFPAERIHIVRAASPTGSPIAAAGALMALGAGYFEAHGLLGRLRPAAVAGFGGYPTVPPLLAAVHRRVPTLIHDANAVMGRANRLLARWVRLVAMGFEATGARNAVVTGNPVRPAMLEAAKMPYPRRRGDEPFNLLVFGGSQGARFFAEAVPPAVARLSAAMRPLVRVVQQARPEDAAAVKAAYGGIGVEAEVAPFFADMAARIAAAHLVISRAGASTVAELSVIGRPAILVPYPHALDHDQVMNARALEQAGGARIELQPSLTPERLAEMLTTAIGGPAALALAAEKAKKTGRPDAAARLADCVEHVAAGGSARDFKGSSDEDA